MSLFKTLKDNRIAAMKAKNTVEKDVLSYVVGQIQKREKDGDEVTDSLVLKEIQKLIKSNVDTGSTDENQYLEKYVPKMLSDEEITVKVNELLDENNVTGTNVKMIGVTMGYFKKNNAGQYDGKTVTDIVRREMLKRE